MIKLKQIFDYIKDVSLWLFLSKAFRSVFYKSNSLFAWRINAWNENNVATYLWREVNGTEENFQHFLGSANPGVQSGTVFIMWWQGEEHAPALVKCCIESLRQHVNGHSLVVISERNIEEYLKMPQFVKDLVKSGAMSFTHLSDLIRLNLLALYGGAWVDATVFCAKPIPEDYFLYPFYSIRTGKKTKDPSHGRWTTFVMFATRNNLIVGKALDYHYRYWMKHKMIADYIMFDYLIDAVVRHDNGAAHMIEAIPVGHQDCFNLINRLDENDFDLANYIKNRDTVFYKLSWKRDFHDMERIVEMLNNVTGKNA